jgi:hypothetical protein
LKPIPNSATDRTSLRRVEHQAEGGLHASGQTKTEPDNELATATKIEHAHTSRKERTANLSAREKKEQLSCGRPTRSEETQHLPGRRRHRSCPPPARTSGKTAGQGLAHRRRLKKPAAHFRDQPSLVLLRNGSRVGGVCEQKPRAAAHLNTTHPAALFREEEPSALLGGKT